MLIQTILAFFEGLALIVSPCILPILPIILSGSLTGSKKRPLGIITGFILAFTLFTFFSREVVRLTGIDLTVVQHISYALLIILSIVMLSTYLTEKFTYSMQWLSSIGSGTRFQMLNNSQGGWLSGFLFGCLVGLIWTPCAGPILAAVIVQTVLQQTTFASFIILLSFSVGAAVPMLLIALLGRKIMDKLTFIKTHPILLRKIVGAIILAVVVYMIYGEKFAVANTVTPVSQKNVLLNGISKPYPAPKIEGISDWINSAPLQLDQLHGKVVLIDFWTYSCINCIRTLPYLNSWYDKYHNAGLEVIGIHTPEFEFEKNLENVKNAVIQDHIHYPVALDNQFETWKNFNNSYWPAHYLIDKNGNVVYQHFGEGEYNVMENNIRYLLGMNAISQSNQIEENNFSETPETYLGYARAEQFASPENVTGNRPASYTFPTDLGENKWALQGDWIIYSDKITSAKPNAAIAIHFNAKKVYVVIGNANGIPIEVKLSLNNHPPSPPNKTTITVNKHTLYPVLEFQHPESATLQLTSSAAGLEVYTFTFGN